MSAMQRELESLWSNLRGRKPHMPNFLSEIAIDGLRGLSALRVSFEYPVSVIAGKNATGKSTVLFAAACAYKVPDSKRGDFSPATYFPDYRPTVGTRRDARDDAIISFDYNTPVGRRLMQLRRRGQEWRKPSFGGRRGATKQERKVYLRTLSNLSNPSEARGILSMARANTHPSESPLTPSEIYFAQQFLPANYDEVVHLSSGKRSILFASLEGGTEYSELHMSAGERAIFRLSREIAQLEGALVLIDELEAGLHPELQQLLMLQMQRLALRNDLQIIVTTHSPVVLNSVPREARIFLVREDDGRVVVSPPYLDIIQDALYGRSPETLNVLCEDRIAVHVLHGVLDYLVPKEGFVRGLIRIESDTGAAEFPTYAKALGKFGKTGEFVFVLDGDQHGSGIEDRIRKSTGSDNTPVLYLPGQSSPELWVWSILFKLDENICDEFGTTKTTLVQMLRRFDAIYNSASGSPSEIAKHKLYNLADELDLDAGLICRRVVRSEANKKASAIQPLLEQLTDIIRKWRAT